ncbi:hypothetical protein D3C72_2520900 [compost metagenome]
MLNAAVAFAAMTLVAGLPMSIDVTSRLVGWKSPVPLSNTGDSSASTSVTMPRAGLSARCG